MLNTVDPAIDVAPCATVRVAPAVIGDENHALTLELVGTSVAPDAGLIAVTAMLGACLTKIGSTK